MRIASLSFALLPFLAGACSTTVPSHSAENVLLRKPTGMIEVEGGKVWYCVRGEGRGTPLLVLHGGPGVPHDYLENLEELGDERPVVFYDQLGSGQSEGHQDSALWTRERYSREVGEVRKALGLDEVILYGHSWGSILAVDYMSGCGGVKPAGVRGLILAGPALDVPQWNRDAKELVATLPKENIEAITEAERTGNMDNAAYKAATDAFYARYLCRADPWPDGLQRAFAKLNFELYGAMNGPSEFSVSGSLKDLDLTSKLGGLGVPVLYVCGEFDEARPETTRAYAAKTPHSEVVVVAGAAHIANFDRPKEYMQALRGWLAAHDH